MFVHIGFCLLIGPKRIQSVLKCTPGLMRLYEKKLYFALGFPIFGARVNVNISNRF